MALSVLGFKDKSRQILLNKDCNMRLLRDINRYTMDIQLYISPNEIGTMFRERSEHISIVYRSRLSQD